MTTNNSLAGGPRVSLLRTGAAILLGAGIAMTALSQPPPQVGTSTNSQRNFLTFSAGKSLVENHFTAQAYMNLIDPSGSKKDFVDWLVNARFISDRTQWTPNGQQTFVDQTQHPNTYGPGMINAFAHIIILNAADLGFIRNQYIRCVPDCRTPNAKIYSYLENYGPTQYLLVDPVTGDPDPNTSTTNTPEAVTIALERRSTDQRNGGRIADVAFDFAPAADASNPGFNFGQIYPYVVQDKEKVPFTLDQSVVNPNSTPPVIIGGDCNYQAHNIKKGLAPRNDQVDEQYIWPLDRVAGVNNDQGVWDCKFNPFDPNVPNVGTRGPKAPFPPVLNAARPDLIGFLQPAPFERVQSGNIFAAELDGLGTKESPGVCLMCHGGNIPSTLTSSGAGWPPHGYIKEFRYLPADAVNSIFGCNDLSSALGTASACQASHFDNPAYIYNRRSSLSPLVVDNGIAATPSDATLDGQQIQLKKYNQAVLINQGAKPPTNAVFDQNGVITGGAWRFATFTDGTITRPTAGVELILGWYAASTGDRSMGASSQNSNFVPAGWSGAVSSGPAQPPGSSLKPSDLYLNVVARNCRSCHMNRELSLDLGTEQQFVANKGNIQDWVFQPECDFLHHEVKPDQIVMPAARLTWERLWNGIRGDSAQTPTIPPNTANNQTRGVQGTTNDSTAVNDPTSQINILKAYLGQTPTSYCKTH